MTFDRLLELQLRRIAIGLAVGGAAGCDKPSTNATATGAPTTATGVAVGTTTTGTPLPPCEGGPLGPDEALQVGYVKVAVGDPCPEAPLSLSHTSCCPTYAFVGPICGFEGVMQNQLVIHGWYGTYFRGYPDTLDTADYYPYQVEGPFDICLYEAVFLDTGTCCGRPLLDGGAPVVAPIRRGHSAWAAAGAVVDADPDVRARIAASWLEAAALEHASVASFARFTLDLMRHGAPPALLEAAQRAALDEIDHARRCFAIASRALGQPVGPGPMPIPPDTVQDRLGFVEALVREGCVGETLAAMEAAARRAGATDPEVVAALDVIQRDEARHAALAWETLAWLLAGDDGSVRARAEQGFAAEQARLATPVRSRPVAPAERAHGLLDPAVRHRVLADGFAAVVRAAADRLFADGPRP